jgi:hypothetical protein
MAFEREQGAHDSLFEFGICCCSLSGHPVNDGFYSCEMYATFLNVRNPHRTVETVDMLDIQYASSASVEIIQTS